MTMHDERWTLGVAENGDIRLRDLKTGKTRRYAGQYGLTDAIGKLADWREETQDRNWDIKGRVHFLLPYKFRMACGRKVGEHWGSALNIEAVNCSDCLSTPEAQNAHSRHYGATHFAHRGHDQCDVHGDHPHTDDKGDAHCQFCPTCMDAQHKSDSDVPTGYTCEGEKQGICSGGPAHHPNCPTYPGSRW